MTIHFYSTKDEHGCFSNFSRHSLHLKGRTWKTSEHFFQAQKFAGTRYEKDVADCNKPSEAAAMGRDRSLPLRRDWESIKDNIMRAAVLAKFAQNKDCMQTLLSTGTEVLVEHTTNDSYWADGGDGSGKNMLGRILMEVRDVLVKQVEWVAENFTNKTANPKDKSPISKYVEKFNLIDDRED